MDATGVVPFFGDEPSVIEIKTRGPEAYKRWRKLGAERSHPESVAQAAFYSYGTFGEARDVVIATMDTGSQPVGLRGDSGGPGGPQRSTGPASGWVPSAPTTCCTGGTLRPCRSGTSPPTTGSANAAPS